MPAGRQRVTELEGCVLGFIGAEGPCTPYAVRQEFLRSPSPHWSGSAGAIYPLIARLLRRGLVRQVGGTDDGRGTLYTLSAAGRRALDAWFGPPLAPLTVGTPPDPLRTRVRFFAVLPPGKRHAFLRDAANTLRAHLADIGRDCARRRAAAGGSSFEYLMARGAFRAARARLEWIEELARAYTVSPT